MKRQVPVIALVVALYSLIGSGKGLQCWTCDNQPSIFHCMFRGEMKTCLANQNSCETSVRRCGTKLAVRKGCKQTQSCMTNARIQVTPNSFGITECNTNQESSICTCCCQGERCNLNSNPCRGMQFDCRPRGNFEGGATTCTDENRVGSECNFQCTEAGFLPYPVDSRSSRCLNYGQWTQPVPCCARACPSNLHRDILFLRQSTTEAMWTEFQDEVINFAFSYNFGDDNLRVGVLSFGSKINTENAIFLNSTAAQNRVDFTDQVSTLVFVNNTDGEVRTGDALNYASETFFSEELGDRLSARNVIVLMIDNSSNDDVAEIAKVLREAGIEIIVIGSLLNTMAMYQSQLLNIAGSPENIIFSRTDDSHIDQLISVLCRNPCA